MIYPGEGHSLEGVKAHLHRTLEQFLVSCLGPALLSPHNTPYTASGTPYPHR